MTCPSCQGHAIRVSSSGDFRLATCVGCNHQWNPPVPLDPYDLIDRIEALESRLAALEHGGITEAVTDALKRSGKRRVPDGSTRG